MRPQKSINEPLDDGRARSVLGTQAQKGRKGFQPVTPDLKRIAKVFHIQNYLNEWLGEESNRRSMSRSEFVNVLILEEMQRVIASKHEKA